MLESMLDPFILLEGVRDGDGQLVDLRYVAVNDAALTYNKLSREQIVGARLLDLFPGQLEHGPLRQYFHTIETGEPTVLDDYAYGHEILGEERRYDIRATRCGDGVALTWRDVTDRHRVAAALATSEQEFRLLAENSSDMVFLRDENLVIRWASPSCGGVLGLAVDEVVGRSVNDFVPPEDVAGMADQVAQMHQTGSSMQYRIRVRGAEGTYRWFAGLSRPIAGSPDEGRRWVVSLHDIEAQVRAEEELAERERLYRLLAENSTDAILLATGPDATCVWASPSVGTLLGWTPDELLGRQPVELIHPDDLADAEESFEGAVQRGEDLRQQYRVRRADGSYRWVEAATRLVPGTDPFELVVRLRDIDDQVHAQRLVSESERLYRLLAENATDVILLATADAEFLWVSASAEPTLGWRPEELVGHRAYEFVAPETRDRLRDDIHDSNRSMTPLHQRYRWRRPDGTYHWVEAIGRPVADVGTGQPGRVVTLREIDAEVVAQQDLREREHRYRLLAENASDVVWQVSEDGTLTWISPSAEAVFGRPTSELIGTPSTHLLCPDDRDHFAKGVEQVRGGHSATGEFRICSAGGELRWMEGSVHAAEAGSGAARIATLRDVDDTVRARRGLEFALQHDQATGLPTRSAMADRIDRVLAGRGPRARVAVLIIGVDLLSDVNDAYGHAVGDMVITATATRLARALGRPDRLGRGAGDEFIAVMPGIAGAAEAVTLAEQLRSAVRGDLEVGGQSLSLSASVGIAVSEPGSTAADLLREATTALHRAKELGRDRWSFADPERAGDAARRLALESGVRAGLDAGEFVPWFQPIVRLSDDSLAGFEALARWRHEGRTLEPAEFLDVLLHAQWITRLDHAIVEPSVAALANQRSDVFVSINVTGLTLARAGYATHVRQCLERHGVDPHRLHIEVTETMLLNLDEPVLAQMIELADLGVRWYVDDFGTGYSAISHLRDMPVSGLKLDRSFTEGIGRGDSTARHLANGLVGLANGLGLDSVAEGVETRAEADYLRTLGWRHAQGWLYGKPAPLT